MIKEFLIGTLLIGIAKAIVVKWSMGKGVDFFDWVVEKYILKTAEDVAIWLHWKKKRKGLGHNAPNPIVCQDEDCRLI